MAPPEFYVDRNLGRRLVDELRADGWLLHRIAELFPGDATQILDSEWVRHAQANGCCALTKDWRIWSQLPPENRIPIFALSDGKITASEMALRFRSAKSQIWSRAESADPIGLWMIYEPGRQIYRRFPKSQPSME